MTNRLEVPRVCHGRSHGVTRNAPARRLLRVVRVDAVIDQLQRKCAARPGTLMLGGGLPADELFPTEALKAAFARALRSPASALQYGWPEGTPDLRAWIAGRMRARGVAVDPEDVIVTAGAQQGLAIACEALLGEERGRRSVAVDDATYPAALDVFRNHGARIVGDPRDATFAYVMPTIANPHGSVMSERDRVALLERARAIVEDDAYGELVFQEAAPPLASVARDRVWHVGTLSKTLCPGLRVGWLVPPRSARDGARAIKQAQDLQVGSLVQAAVSALFERFDYAAHVARSLRTYRARAAALMDAVRATFPAWRFEEPRGGFSIFVETGEEVDDARFLARAAAHGVAFDPGRLFRVAPEGRPLALRLCYSASRPAALREGVRRLARAWDETRSRR